MGVPPPQRDGVSVPVLFFLVPSLGFFWCASAGTLLFISLLTQHHDPGPHASRLPQGHPRLASPGSVTVSVTILRMPDN